MMKKILALCLVLCFTNSLRAQDWVVLQNKPPMTKEEMAKAIAERKPFVNSLGMEFIWIEPGTFSAGAHMPYGEIENQDEFSALYSHIYVSEPAQKKIKEGFYLATHETTWRQSIALLKFEMRYDKKYLDYTAWNIGFDQARKFIELLQKTEIPPGRYRMPTALEWEYACKAGRVEPLRKEGQPHPDKDQTDPFQPNPWGLFGMTNGIEEWYETDYTISSGTNIDPEEKGSPVLHFLNAAGTALKLDSVYMTCSNTMREDPVEDAAFRLAFTPY